MIEREAERVWLQTALSEVLDGRGCLVLLAGEAGVGKTRFTESVVESTDVRLLRGPRQPGRLPAVSLPVG